MAKLFYNLGFSREGYLPQIVVSYTTTRGAKLSNVTIGHNKLLNNLPIWSFFGGGQAALLIGQSSVKTGGF